MLNFLFPRRCLGCGKKGVYFCSECQLKIKLLYPQIKFGVYPLDFLVSVFPYQGIIRRAILKLKYQFIYDLVDELVDLTVRLIKQDLFEYSNNLNLVPVPLHWYRQNWRGFNQSEILGQKIAQRLKIDFSPHLLIRTSWTKPQIKLKEKERKRNIKGVFKVNFKNFKLHNQYLLFDDVWTTGATMKECALVLKKAGVKRVFGLTLAR